MAKKERIQVISKREGQVTLMTKARKNAVGMLASTPITIVHGINWWEGDTALLKEALDTPLGKVLQKRGEISVNWDKIAILDTDLSDEADTGLDAIKASYARKTQKAMSLQKGAEEALAEATALAVAEAAKNNGLEKELADAKSKLADADAQIAKLQKSKAAADALAKKAGAK